MINLRSGVLPCLFLGVVLATVTLGYAQDSWENIGPTTSGLKRLIVHPAEPEWVYVATPMNLYRSEDGGDSWVSTGIHELLTLQCLAADPHTPQRLYLGSETAGVFFSSDAGDTWIHLTPQGSDLGSEKVYAIAVDPHQDRRVAAAVQEGIYWSEDGGETWYPSETPGISGEPIQVLTFDPTRHGVIYAGSDDGVFVSRDGGHRFLPSAPGPNSTAIGVTRQEPFPVYARFQGPSFRAALQISYDAGQTWSLSPELPRLIDTVEGHSAPAVTAIAVDPRNPDAVYLGTRHGIVLRGFASTGDWEEFSDGFPMPDPSSNSYTPPGAYGLVIELGGIAVIPRTPYQLYVLSDRGLYRRLLPELEVRESEVTSEETGDDTTFTSTGPTLQITSSMRLGVAVSHIHSHPSENGILYAGTPSGTIHRRDASGTWTPASTGLPRAHLLALEIDPADGDVLYAGFEGSAGLYKSVDGGDNWFASNGERVFSSVFAVAVNPQDPGTVFAGIRTGIFRSTDSGRTWNLVLAGQSTEFTSFAFSPREHDLVLASSRTIRDTYFHYGFKAKGTEGIWESRDAGNTWEQILDDRSVSRILIDPFDPLTRYAVSRSRFLGDESHSWISDTSGTWHALTAGDELNVEMLKSSPANPSTLYGATDRHILRSNDAEDSWKTIGQLPESTVIHAIDVAPDGETVYVATNRGVFSNDGLGLTKTAADLWAPDMRVTQSSMSTHAIDTTWTQELSGENVPLIVPTGMDLHAIYAVVKPNRIFGREKDGSWIEIGETPETPIQAMAVDPHNPATLFIGQRNGLYRSDDGGRSWKRTHARDYLSVSVISINPRDPEDLFVHGYPDFLRSQDGGVSLDPSVPNLYGREYGFETESTDFDPFWPNRVFAAGLRVHKGLYRSDDGGLSWNVSIGGNAKEVVADPHTPGRIFARVEGRLWRSDDAGHSWQAAAPYLSIPSRGYVFAIGAAPGILYFTDGNQVLETLDDGNAWTDISAGLEGEIHCVAADLQRPGMVYAGTESGIFSICRPLSAPYTGSEITHLHSIELVANYPNPFKTSTTIGFTVPEDSEIRLSIYNLLGQKIATLISGPFLAGPNTVNWDGRDSDGRQVASGVYIVKIEANQQTRTRKLVLIR